MKILEKAEITGIRTPAAVASGYKDIIGLTLEVTGNAYHGFQIILPNDSRRDLMHFNYKPIYR